MYGSWITKDIILKQDLLLINSEILKREIACSVLFPEEYNKAEPLNLLLVNGSGNLDTLRIKAGIEDLSYRQQINQVMVLAIHSDRLSELFHATDSDGADRCALQYNSFIVDEVIPMAKAYAGLNSFGSIVLMGCGLAGTASFKMVWNNPEIFDKVGIFSGTFFKINHKKEAGYNTGEERIVHRLVSNTPGRPDLKFWFHAGTRDVVNDRNHNGINDIIDDTIDLIQILERKGFSRPEDIQYVELIGGECQDSHWARAVPRFLKWAF
jgi:enterochelin esterase family protein